MKALKLIIDYDVEITNGMVQQFILPKEVPNRTKIMEAVAQHCYDRTQFQVRPNPNPFFIHLVKTILFVVFHKKIGDKNRYGESLCLCVTEFLNFKSRKVNKRHSMEANPRPCVGV